MGKPDKYQPPTSSIGDTAHALTKAGIGSIPIVGGAGAELFQLIIAPPLEKRRAEWMSLVDVGLRELEANQSLRIEELTNNEGFIDSMIQASRAALATHEREKLESLRNAVLNSALPQAPDDSRRHIFINWVDSLRTSLQTKKSETERRAGRMQCMRFPVKTSVAFQTPSELFHGKLRLKTCSKRSTFTDA